MALSKVDLPAPLVPSKATTLALANLELGAEQHLQCAVLHLYVGAAQQDVVALDVADLHRLDRCVDAAGTGRGRREVDAATSRDDAEQPVADREQRGRQTTGKHE